MASKDTRVGIPGAHEAMAAFDMWTEAVLRAQEEAGFEELEDFLDHMDEVFAFDLATPEEKAELAAEIGMDLFIKVAKDIDKSRKRLGLLG